MLEIIILVYLCMKMSRLAESKNLPARRWILQTVLNWILVESLFILITLTIGLDVMYVIVIGPLGGYLGYLLVRKKLEDMPDGTPPEIMD